MKRLLDIILRLSHYNVKIVFGNKFVYFVLSAVIFYILTVVINLFFRFGDYGGDGVLYVVGTVHIADILPDVLRDTERPGCQDYRDYFRYPELPL